MCIHIVRSPCFIPSASMFYNAVRSAVIMLTRLRSIKSAIQTNVPIDRSILPEKYFSFEICHKSSIILAA